MHIKIQKDEKVDLSYSECPMCHKSFNQKKRKKTSHHVIPLVLNPLTEIKMNLCMQCHEKLNKLTGQFEISRINNERHADDFGQFLENYEDLRSRFKSKEINRGEFGEGLWSNLISYLTDLDQEVKLGKEKK